MGTEADVRRLASARREQLSNSWRMTGDRYFSAPALKSRSLTSSWRRYCSMELKPGEPPSPLWKESRLSLGRRILKIRWLYIISNQDMLKRTRQQPIKVDILQRRWKWIGHTLRKPLSRIPRQALTRNPQRKRKRGRTRSSWRRDLSQTWGEMATVHVGRSVTTGLAPWWLEGAYWCYLPQVGL